MTEPNGQKPPETIPEKRNLDASLTLRPRSRANSPQCLNCGSVLHGPFCHYCGQPDRNFMRFFPALLREFMQEFIELDSRFARTMKPLLFKPGRLTRDYLLGRRYKYTPPLRLYLFSSIIFFVLAANISSEKIKVQLQQDAEKTAESASSEASERTRSDELFGILSAAQVPDAERIVDVYETHWDTAPDEASKPAFEAGQINLNGEPWDPVTNPFEMAWLPDSFNHWVNKEIATSPDTARRIAENPNVIVEKIFELLPGTMFVMLPIAALVLKIWYLFARRFYIEHLIFSLHLHSFVYVSLAMMLLFELSAQLVTEGGQNAFGTGLQWAAELITLWIPLYLLLALRCVYQQGWGMTVVKFVMAGGSYLAILGATTSIAAILGFLLL